MGTARPFIPGVPAAGHISERGFWHPGRPDGCPKCPTPTPTTDKPTERPRPCSS